MIIRRERRLTAACLPFAFVGTQLWHTPRPDDNFFWATQHAHIHRLLCCMTPPPPPPARAVKLYTPLPNLVYLPVDSQLQVFTQLRIFAPSPFANG